MSFISANSPPEPAAYTEAAAAISGDADGRSIPRHLLEIDSATDDVEVGILAWLSICHFVSAAWRLRFIEDRPMGLISELSFPVALCWLSHRRVSRVSIIATRQRRTSQMPRRLSCLAKLAFAAFLHTYWQPQPALASATVHARQT